MAASKRSRLTIPQIGMLCAIAAILVFVLWSCARGNGGGEGLNGVRNPDQEAIAGCESLVSDQLRSPSSADFSSSVTNDGGEWTVTGSVDADNAFGTQVRTEYTCTVTFPGDGRVRTVIDSIG